MSTSFIIKTSSGHQLLIGTETNVNIYNVPRSAKVLQVENVLVGTTGRQLS